MLQVGQSLARRMALPGASVEPIGLELTGFCEQFVSDYHQAKEFHLFTCLLRSRHSVLITPIVGLHYEHSKLTQMSESLTVAWRLTTEGLVGGCELCAGTLADYVALLQAHLLKEDRFYGVVAHLLDDSDQAQLGAAFAQLELATATAGGHERYVRWAVDQATRA